MEIEINILPFGFVTVLVISLVALLCMIEFPEALQKGIISMRKHGSLKEYLSYNIFTVDTSPKQSMFYILFAIILYLITWGAGIMMILIISALRTDYLYQNIELLYFIARSVFVVRLLSETMGLLYLFELIKVLFKERSMENE